MDIKSCYIYYDKRLKIYNMFIFLHHYGMAYCIHRITNDINIFFVEDMLLSEDEGTYVYIYDNINSMTTCFIDVIMSRLPGTKQIPVIPQLETYIRCFDCYSCNFWIYMLVQAYIEDPCNILNNGVNAKYEKFIFKTDEEPEKLGDILNYNKEMIVKSNSELFDKITRFIKCGYNVKMFDLFEPEESFTRRKALKDLNPIFENIKIICKQNTAPVIQTDPTILQIINDFL